MALDYWKLAGKPSSYEPLPTGFGNQALLGLGEFVVKFKAKSNSGAILRLAGINGNFRVDGASQRLITLTSVLTDYSATISTLLGAQPFLFHDNGSVGDIVIKEIKLNQKSLPKLTINGIDGFLSGKWTLHANVTVLDDETLELNATGVNQTSNILINVQPNNNYVLNIEHNGKVSVNDGSWNPIVSYTTNKTISFNSGTKSQIIIALSSNDLGAGKFTFKKPMLNLGTTPAPYSKKTSADSKMVLPTPKGNLVQTDVSMWEQGTIGVTYDSITTATNRIRSLVIGYQIGKQYTISCANGYEILANPGTSGNTVFGNPVTFTATGALGRIVVRKLDQSNLTPSDIAYAKPMLNEGTTAQPYTPYAVQVNKKPKRYVPKKNLVRGDVGFWTNGTSATGDGIVLAFNTDSTRIRTIDYIGIIPNKTYTAKVQSGYEVSLIVTDGSNVRITVVSWSESVTYTAPSNAYKFWFVVRKTGGLTNISTSEIEQAKPQLEEGLTATPYEPYQLVLPKAKNGLAFNGTSDYLQLPSMTMDSIEIDCLIDNNSNVQFLMDSRAGLANGYVYTDNSTYVSGSGISTVTGFKKGERTLIKIMTPLFTDNVNIFCDAYANGKTKGTLYKVTCYLNNQVVATYDFENPATIVRDKVLPNAVNLIPSFEDSRWSLHANADVLGKDVLRLEASGTFQVAYVDIPVIPNTNYQYLANHNSKIAVYKTDNSTVISAYTTNQSITFNSGLNTIVRLAFSNTTTATGTFDFIKPQLYELSGKEGALVSRPTLTRKQARRILYAKR